MKRMLTGFLSAALVLSNIPLPAFAQEPVEIIDVMPALSQSSGKLDVVIQMDYRETAGQLAKRNLSLTLLGSGGQSHKLLFGGSGGEQEFQFGGKTVQARITLHNPQDTPLAGNDKVGFFLLSFTGLPQNLKYQVKLEGKGYSSFLSQEISLDRYAQKLSVSAQSGGFALGDITGDAQITQSDLDRVADALGQNGADADLNFDGKVNIVDLALVHHNLGTKGPAGLYDGELAVVGILDTDQIAQELEKNGVRIEGNLDDLFTDNGQVVKLTNTSGGLLEIPITFDQPQIMGEMKIVSPAVNGALERGSVLVAYEDGSTEQIAFDNTAPDGVHATERSPGERTVTIQLNKRVPVKKITITVEKVMGEDGKVSYAVIEKIEFLKDIVPPNIDLGASVPKEVAVQAGSKQATLTWRSVDNVDGYLVKYGLSASALNHQIRVNTNQAVVGGLENLKTYYFTVSAYSGDWTGDPSQAVSCIPQPDKAPLAPDNLSLSADENAITVQWKAAEDAEFYNVYYKESSAETFQLAKEKVAGISYTVTGLTNDVSYDFYVVSGNRIGISKPSLTATGKPEKEEIKIPELPASNRIPNSEIISAAMEAPANVAAEYQGEFDPKWVYDGNFETHWTARAWWESSRFTFEFDEEKSMDYLIYVPRLNKGYPASIQKYSIAAWDKEGNMTWLTDDAGSLTNRPEGNVSSAPNVRNNPQETGYAILPFKRNDHIKKISVLVRQWDGAPKPSSLAEIAFYAYDNIDDSIRALFTDDSYTAVASGISQAQIDELRGRVQQEDGYYVNKEVLLEELALAESLLKGDRSQLGAVHQGIQSRDASEDQKKINTFQPLGVTAEAGKQIVVYAQIPDGETVDLVPTQHYAEAAKWSGTPIRLENGRNLITIPKLNSLKAQAGGSLYLQYAGDRGDQIKLQVRGAVKIPTLELSDWHALGETEIKKRISTYVDELNSYYAETLSGLSNDALQTSILNATEIAFPHVLLSLPASQVRAGLGSDGVTTLYHDGLAWEELMQLSWYTYGIDADGLEKSASRHNIRYMRMFGNAFMYAGANHIGIGYGSSSGMVSGKPTAVTGAGNANGLFGWGIQHEIGHVMDTLGKAEITNNIYSLFAQTRDGQSNALTSRLESSGKYEDIFEKVTSGQTGMSNDVFVSLGMYWQLHLAYDNADGNFYHELNKVISGKSDAQFAAAASQVSGRDLTEFFTSWGMPAGSQSGPAEERKIQYLTDESRRERLAGTGRQSGSVGISASFDASALQASVSITPVSGAKMQGYEISRTLNGKTEPVAFLSAKSGQTTWTDSIGSVNNKTVTYSVKAVDILGYVISEASCAEIKISHDNLIEQSSYQWSSQSPVDGVLTATFSGSQPVAGIKFHTFPAAGAPIETDPTQSTSTELETHSSTEVLAATTEDEGDMIRSSEAAGSSSSEEQSGSSEAAGSSSSEGQSGSSEAAGSSSSEDQSSSSEAAGSSSSEDQSSSSEAAGSSSSEEQSSSSEAAGSSSSEEQSSSSEAAGSSSSEEQSSSSEAAGSSSSEEQSSSSEAAGSSSSEEQSSSSQSEAVPETGMVKVEASTDGSSFATVLEISYQELREQPGKLRFFTRKDADGSICPVEAKTIRISGLPAGVVADQIGFAAYPGDDIEFAANGIGIMGRSYGGIKAGQLVVTGSFRGNPVFNTVRVYGRSQSGDMTNGELTESGKIPLEGEIYLFAAMPETGEMAEIDNGLWIFVPKQQNDASTPESGEGTACFNSQLPTWIMAELHRKDVPEGGSGRITSDTRWIPSPTYETMPTIILED